MSRRPRFRKNKSKKISLPFEGAVRVSIESLGGQGDGIAFFEGHKLYVAGALPGEEVSVRAQSKKGDGFTCQLISIEEASDDRVVPPCPHYDLCGGCSLQHLDEHAYRDWKQSLVREALVRRGLADADIKAVLATGAGVRRRVAVRLRGAKGKVKVGFNSRSSHDMAVIDRCLLVTPGLDAALDQLRGGLGSLLKGGGEATALLTETATGIDAVLTYDQDLSLEDRETLACLTNDADFAKLSWRRKADQVPEVVAMQRQPVIDFDGVKVAFPAGGFLQPSREGEDLLKQAVLDGFDGVAVGRVLDLYAGLGTFSFPLAKHAIVHAVEGSDVLGNAIHLAAGHAGLGGRVTAECRDLEQSPLMGDDLKPYDAVVIDPPRAGARAQMEAIADSSYIKTVAAVSCNPLTFARDMRILVDGGFKLASVQPVDQFTWSTHLEVVAVLKRERGA